jgi:hypothetical protein
MIKRVLTVLVFLSFTSLIASAQQAASNDDKPRRWFVGGNLGLMIGNVTLIDVSPFVGYMLSERFAIGTGATYKYYRIKNYHFDYYQNQYYHFRSHIFGGPVFARYYISRDFFAHSEYEFLRFRNEIYVDNPSDRRYDRQYVTENVHSMFVGGGYRQRFGSGNAFEIMLLWNLNETLNSPYENPVIRMGFAIGL